MYTFQEGATDVTTYWKAYDVTTGAEYSGTEIAHNATGLTLMYARYKTAAVSAVTAGSPAPADLANGGSTHADWGWVRVAGPFYRADFPDAAFATGVPFTLLGVYGVANVAFTQVSLLDITASDPRAAALADTAIADAVLDEAVEGSTTLRQLTRLFASVLLGKANGLAGTTANYRDLADTKNRVVATVDADGNRSAVTLDAA